MLTRKHWLVLCLMICTGCAALVSLDLDKQYGKAAVTNRATAQHSEADVFLRNIKPVLEQRCVVCHACYDSPCQLNMSSAEGIERGAHKDKVYDGTRLLAATPNRLFTDAFSISQWRERGFFPVLNERKQSSIANTQASVLAQLLQLKQQHPLPNVSILPDSFDFSLDREQSCPSIEQFDQYAKSQPLAGMPYGLPALNSEEHGLLMRWLATGAAMPAAAPLSAELLQAVAQFEHWLNTDTLKMQLSARYIYEHLFTSHLYFSANETADITPQYFKLVRSASAPGNALDVIASRRPFDDPNVERVYYRLQPVTATIVDKTHQPYAITPELLQKWQQWFVEAKYQVSRLPSYEPEVAANPLTAFAELPVMARYRFMLERAENTIMGYIKGPVCRGQVALNVINDHFWVFFVAPEIAATANVEAFYLSQRDNLRMPAEKDSSTIGLSWVAFAKRQGNYLRARSEFLNQALADGKHLTLDSIWAGDGSNQNASLTVFRHFDNATVVKGLIGQQPKTAWVIDYALLERIHYLLVAGFDVYGNFGHQLMTRLYMDFLRMEGESNFVAFLPEDSRRSEFASWYQRASPELTDFIKGDINPFNQPSGIQYQTEQHKAELFNLLHSRLARVQPTQYPLHYSSVYKNQRQALQQLASLSGKAASLLPELTMIMLETGQGGEPELFTLVRNSAHYNVNSLFAEDDNRNPAQDNVTLVRGLLGSYPNAFWRLKAAQLPELVKQLAQLSNEQEYKQLLDRYGVRRTAADFWQFSDKLNQLHLRHHPVQAGLLDYNRLENR